MGLGIIGVVRGQRVPGTSTLFEKESSQTEAYAYPGSSPKHGSGGDGEIVLVPQPSDHPDDPLTWPLWKRDLIFVILCTGAIIATTLSPILAADSLDLAFYYNRDFTEIALLTGYHLLGVGIGGIIFVPSGRVWGKRHLFLLGSLIVCVSSAWGGASNTNYKSLLWARIFQGIGLAPFEALVGAAVGDLYFVHERGLRMALSTMTLFGSAFMTPVVVGKIASTLGWQWSFYFVSIFSGVVFFLIFLFVPETAYVRDAALNTDMAGHRFENGNSQSKQRHAAIVGTLEPKGGYAKAIESSGLERHIQERHMASAVHQRTPYAKRLRPFNGRKTNESFFKLLLRPFPLFLQPSLLWAALIQGTLIGWTVLIGIVLAAILLGPPLFFTEVQVGYMYTSAFIGALAGFGIVGLVADPSAKFLTKCNGGEYEPEFRLVLVLPQLVLGGVGLYGFGWTVSDTYKYGWIGPEVLFGFVTAGMVCGAAASALYVIDGYRELAVEAFTCLIIFKNIFSFALTFRGYDWLINQGIKQIFIITASIQTGVCVSTVFIYIFGKVIRAFFARLSEQGTLALLILSACSQPL